MTWQKSQPAIVFIGLAASAALLMSKRLQLLEMCDDAALALVGAAVLLGVDTISQPLFAPIQLPVSVVTVSIGGLHLIWLLIRESHR